ncbi:MAG: tRNA (guanosine(37)-N1)-methyltransferase TrmD, partial [Kiritimatiellia bacterium]|nr:tRNA (guanosine(37)-N1)-methyltransferase TrmD [Kiritimatiellia bacterium]
GEGATEDESFSHGLLEYPQYTRPASFRGMEVPAILMSGNHGEVDKWRRKQATERTQLRRPDLITKDVQGKDNQHGCTG